MQEAELKDAIMDRSFGGIHFRHQSFVTSSVFFLLNTTQQSSILIGKTFLLSCRSKTDGKIGLPLLARHNLSKSSQGAVLAASPLHALHPLDSAVVLNRSPLAVSLPPSLPRPTDTRHRTVQPRCSGTQRS